MTLPAYYLLGAILAMIAVLVVWSIDFSPWLLEMVG